MSSIELAAVSEIRSRLQESEDRLLAAEEKSESMEEASQWSQFETWLAGEMEERGRIGSEDRPLAEEKGSRRKTDRLLLVAAYTFAVIALLMFLADLGRLARQATAHRVEPARVEVVN